MLEGDINVTIKRKKLEQDWGLKLLIGGGEQLYVKYSERVALQKR